MELVDTYANRLEIQNMSRHIFQGEGENPLIVYVVEPTQPEGA